MTSEACHNIVPFCGGGNPHDQFIMTMNFSIIASPSILLLLSFSLLLWGQQIFAVVADHRHPDDDNTAEILEHVLEEMSLRGVEEEEGKGGHHNMGSFFLEHAAALKVPTKVLSFTTNDLYREGYNLQNCHDVMAHNFSFKTITDEQRLICTLLHDYSPLSRPVKDMDTILVVNFSLAINQIFDLDDRNQLLVMNVWYEQTWVDESLRWNPSDYNGVTAINIPSFYIFLPDLELYNTAADYTRKRAQFRAMVNYDGTVFYGNPTKLVSTCHVNPTWFPFDTQVCTLKFGSWTHSGLEIDLQPNRIGVDLSRLVSHGKWDVVEVIQKRHSVQYTCCPEPYIDISYYIFLKRRSMFYLLSVYFSTFILVLMTISAHQLPIDAGEKCGLGTSVLFSLSVFMLSLGEKLPESSDYIPIINVYLFIVMTMCALSLVCSVGIHAIHFQHARRMYDNRKSQIRSVPPWLMAVVRFYRRKLGEEVSEGIRDRLAEYNKKKVFVKKLRSFQKNLELELQKLKCTRFTETPPTLLRRPKKPPIYPWCMTSSTTCPYLCNSGRSEIRPRKTITRERLDFYQMCLVNRIREVQVAIVRVAENYEWQITCDFRLIAWHELAEFFDMILFWGFLSLFFLALFFVFILASLAAPDAHSLAVDKIQQTRSDDEERR